MDIFSQEESENKILDFHARLVFVGGWGAAHPSPSPQAQSERRDWLKKCSDLAKTCAEIAKIRR